MSRFTPKLAVRTGQKARLALSGPSGSGKTYAGLTVAEVLADGGKVLVIDTERGSSSLYSDRFTFDIVEWVPPFDPRELAQEMRTLAAGYAVVVIDSLSHFWQGEGGTQSIVDAAAARAKGNTYVGWAEGTPAQDAMVNSLLLAPCHVIATMRSKTDYVLEQRNGKTIPVKVGMAPIQRPGIDFEFTVTCELDRDHNVLVDKSRCEAIADKVFSPGEAATLGQALRDWLAGAEPGKEAAFELAPEPEREEIATRIAALPEEKKARIVGWLARGEVTVDTLPATWLAKTYEVLEKAESA